MNTPPLACKICGRPLPQRAAKGRRRVYCGDACRNVAYLQRRGEQTGTSAPPGPERSLDRDYAYEVENVERIRPRDRTELDDWMAMGQKFDDILDSPVILARFMDELLCRIARSGLLEDYRNQRAVNQLIVIYFMIGRITDGGYTLPAVADW